MIKQPSNFTEQMLNFAETIAIEMRAVLNTAMAKVDKEAFETRILEITGQFPTKVSSLENDANYLTADTVDFSEYPTKTELADTLKNYMATSGGVMTEAIKGQGESSNGLQLFSGSNEYDGASLQLYARENESNPGVFVLRASNKESSTSSGSNYDLVGTPDGKLTWGAKTVAFVGDYLPISGGTVTGNIQFGTNGGKISTSTDGALVISNSVTSSNPNIWFEGSETSGGRISWSSSSGFTLNSSTTITGNVLTTGGNTGTSSIGSASNSFQSLYVRDIQLYNKNGAKVGDLWSNSTDTAFNLAPSTTNTGTLGFDTRRFSTLYVVNGYAGTFKSTSDIRHKEDIKEVTYDLSSIKTYEYILKDDKQKHTGLIAQEVEKVIPYAVTETEDGTKVLDYNAVVAALVSEVNSLKKEIKELRNGK